MKKNVLPLPSTQKKSITILGSTGSIGRNTLDIIAAHPGRFSVTALTAGDNVALLAEQAKRFKPERAVIANAAHYESLKAALHGTGIEAAAGGDAVCEAAAMDTDIVMSAMVGAAGLKPTLAAIRNGRTVALANKECLVSAGTVMKKEIKKHGAALIPVDSEHSGIFQLFGATPLECIETVTITASGGPFRTWTLEQMRRATPEQAVRHPNWSMGAKISVDSATLMNKGLELIEAFYLFPLEASQLKVLVHPQSIVHALLQLADGSMLAQMSHPDMRAPIACALAWPERIKTPVKHLNLAETGTLEFTAPDETRFPALKLAREALEAGGAAPTILNAANEVAVRRFLNNEIGFLDIAGIVSRTLEKMASPALYSIDDVLACDQQARQTAEAV